MCFWAAWAARNVPAQVGGDHGLPVVVRHLVQEVVADDPGAGDEDVEPPGGLRRRGDSGLDLAPAR